MTISLGFERQKVGEKVNSHYTGNEQINNNWNQG